MDTIRFKSFIFSNEIARKNRQRSFFFFLSTTRTFWLVLRIFYAFLRFDKMKRANKLEINHSSKSIERIIITI